MILYVGGTRRKDVQAENIECGVGKFPEFPHTKPQIEAGRSGRNPHGSNNVLIS